MTEPITPSDIAAAEKLMGVSYSPQERAQMVGNLEGQLLSAQARRGVKLDNATLQTIGL